MNVGSLFTGIGGFDLGLERAGMRVVWQCEQDEFCRRVLARHWPGVPCYPDVRTLVADAGSARRRRQDIRRAHGDEGPGAGRSSENADLAYGRGEGDGDGPLVSVPVSYVDVLCGGFPCQDISLAGKGAGIDGTRSGLWGEYARLVGELRPRYVIVENVAALLSRGLGRVLGDLAALGYDAEWDCIPASAVGAPHRRDRLWLVAYPSSGGRVAGQQDVHARESDAAWGGGDVADPECRGRQGWPQDTGRGSTDREAVERREGSGEPAGRGAEARTLADTEGQRQERPRPARQRRAGLADSGCGELQDADECPVQSWRIGGRAAQTGGAEWWAVEPPVGRVAHGVPDRLDQLAALGNALVPQIAEWLGRRILKHEEGRVAA